MTTSTSSEAAAALPVSAATSEATPPANAEATRPRAPSRDAVAGPTLAGRLVVVVLSAAVVLSTLAFGTVHPWSLAVFQAGAGLIVLLWAVDAWRSRTLRLSRSWLQLPLLGLFIVGLVQLLPLGGGASVAGLQSDAARTLSLDPYATRMTLVQLAALFVYFAAALVFIDTPKRLRLVVRVVVVFGAALALFGLLQYFLNPEQIYWLRQPRYARPFGPFINRHHFASYMVLAISLPLGLLFAGAVKRELMPLYVFATVVMMGALAATLSRGALLGLGAELLFLIGLIALAGRKSAARAEDGETGRPPLLRRAGLQLAFGLALVVGVLAFAGDELVGRMMETITSENVTSDRTTFWRGAREIIRERPLLGAGLGAFGVAYTRYDPTAGAARLEQAHNDYLQIIADAGVAGALLGLVFLGSLFRRGFARAGVPDKFRRGVAAGALAGCFGALVHSFFDFPLHLAAVALLFLVLAALATANGRVEEADSSRRRKRRRRAGETPTRPVNSES